MMTPNFRVNTFDAATGYVVRSRYFETKLAAQLYIAEQPAEIRADLYDQRPDFDAFARMVETERQARERFDRTGPHFRPAPMTGPDWDSAWNSGPGGEP